MGKLRNLKEVKEKLDLFLRETADVYLLARVLLKLEKVTQLTTEKSSDYYLEKIKKLYAS